MNDFKLLSLFIGIGFVVAMIVIGIVLLEKEGRSRKTFFLLIVVTMASLLWLYSVRQAAGLNNKLNPSYIEKDEDVGDGELAIIDFIEANITLGEIQGHFSHNKNKKYSVYCSKDHLTYEKISCMSTEDGEVDFSFDYDGVSSYWVKIINGTSTSIIVQEIEIPALEDYFSCETTKPIINKVELSEDDIIVYFDGFVDASKIYVLISSEDGDFYECNILDAGNYTFLGILNEEFSIKSGETYNIQVKYLYAIDYESYFSYVSEEKSILMKN